MTKRKAASFIFVISFIITLVLIQPVTANPGTRLDSLIAYIDKQYDDVEGGYSLREETLSRGEPTFAVLETLNDLGDLAARPPKINITMTKEFVSKLQWTRIEESEEKYGGFSSFIAGNPTISATYESLRAWQILNQHNDYIGMQNVEINETAALVFINRTFTEDGGFASAPNEDADLLTTYQAVYVIDYLAHQLEEKEGTNYATTLEKWLNKTAVINYILDCRDGDAFKNTPESRIAGVTATAAAVMALQVLGKLNTLENLQGIREWLSARQVVTSNGEEFVGGFTEGFQTNDTNLLSTYYALMALDTLGATEGSVNITLATQFIIDCQAADGSWALTPEQSTGETTYIGYAMISLKLLHGAENIRGLLLVEDPNNPNPPLFDWRVLVVAGLFIFAAAACFVSLRLD